MSEAQSKVSFFTMAFSDDIMNKIMHIYINIQEVYYG